MKKALLIMVLLSAAAIVYLGYERLFVQDTFGPAALIGFIVIALFMPLIKLLNDLS